MTSPPAPPPSTRSVAPGLRRWVRVLLSGYVLVLLSLGYLTHRETTEQQEAADLVEHTHLVIEALERIPSGLGAAESGVRGYVLQRDPGFLDEVEPALKVVETAAATARELMADREPQQQRLDALLPKIERRLALLRTRTAIARAQGADEIIPGARLLTLEIRAGVHEMAREEERLLEVRRRIREAHTSRLRIVTPLGIIASISLVVVAFSLVSSEERRRLRAEAEGKEQGARLRRLVDETALMLELGDMLSACRSVTEANLVVEQFAPRFFAHASGAICMLNESQNLLEAHVRWGDVSLLASATFPPDSCWSLRRGKPHRAEADDVTRCAHFADKKSSTFCFPLLANGQVVGTLHVSDGTDADHVERRGMLVGEQVGMALSNLRLRETLRNQSIRDALTGLYNRRYHDETLAREIHRAARESSAVSVLVMDVDFFKKFNDSFGHQAGDLVLASLGSVLRKQTRGADLATRLGGEELAVVLPGARLEDAAKRAEHIRQAVAEMPVVHEGKEIGPVTLSIGVAAFPQHGTRPEDIIRVADAALYRAKREGRNRVIVAD